MAFNNILRMKNLFGPSNSFNQATQPAPPMQTRMQSEPRIDENINVGVEEPGNPALERIYAEMNQMPQRNTPGKLNKVGGFLMALGGQSPEQIDKSVYSPYYREMEEFNNKIDPLLKAGKLESDSMSARSLDDYRRATTGINAFKANTTAADVGSKIADRRTDNERQQDALDLKRKLGDRPDTILRKSPGMPDQLVDKRTGIVIREYPVGTLRDDEYEALRQANRLELAAVQGAIQQQVKQTPSGDSSTQSETQKEAGTVNRAKQLIRTIPDLEEFVIIDNNGVTVSPLIKGVDRQNILDFIEGRVSGPLRTPIDPTGVPPPPPGSVPMDGANNPINFSQIGGRPDATPINPSTPITPPNPGGQQVNPGDKRARAIAQLEKQRKPVNEQTIAIAMSRLK